MHMRIFGDDQSTVVSFLERVEREFNASAASGKEIHTATQPRGRLLCRDIGYQL